MQGQDNEQNRANVDSDAVDSKRRNRRVETAKKCDKLDERKNIGRLVLKRGSAKNHPSARKRVEDVTDKAVFDPPSVATKREESQQEIFLERVKDVNTAFVLYLLYVILSAAVVT